MVADVTQLIPEDIRTEVVAFNHQESRGLLSGGGECESLPQNHHKILAQTSLAVGREGKGTDEDTYGQGVDGGHNNTRPRGIGGNDGVSLHDVDVGIISRRSGNGEVDVSGEV